MADVTLILQRIRDGHAEANNELFAAVYDELRRLAAGKMGFERPDHTLSATALVHEAYVRLFNADLVGHWDSRAHFFSAAAEAMRRILIDHARRKSAAKRGGKFHGGAVGEDIAVLPADPDLLLDLDDAVSRLATADEQAAELLKLVLYAGLSIAEAGRLQGLTRDVAYRHWEFVRSWFAVHFRPPH